jgi:hypothetical protein
LISWFIDDSSPLSAGGTTCYPTNYARISEREPSRGAALPAGPRSAILGGAGDRGTARILGGGPWTSSSSCSACGGCRPACIRIRPRPSPGSTPIPSSSTAPRCPSPTWWRAEALHSAFTDHVIEIVDRVGAPGKLTIAFRHSARHTGPWRTPLGELAPTGRTVSGLGIDVLTIGADQRITRIWVLADELQRILQVHDPRMPA